MNEDDTPTGFKFYRISYDHFRSGWCVWQQTKDDQGGNTLVFNCGPFDTEKEAREMMNELHRRQGFPI